MIHKIMHIFGWLPLRIVFNSFCKFKVFGLENIKQIKEKRAIFVSNHKSYYDPFIIGIGLPWFSKFHPILYIGWAGIIFSSKKVFSCDQVLNYSAVSPENLIED